LLAAAVSSGGSAMAEMPGLLGTDHLGFTVPDMDQAVGFFQDVIGCEPFYQLGPFSGGDSDWMNVHLNVDAKATIPLLRTMRCGHGVNLEIFTYTAPDQQSSPPKNSDIGGHHLAFYVDDMAAAVAHLKAKGVTMFGDPTTMAEGPSAGETWMYFLTPWGMTLELVSYPDGKAYEAGTTSRLWTAKAPAD
jgi:catechol 2,3-dioxygenase-like lactoylglutathione lyase family enzyme